MRRLLRPAVLALAAVLLVPLAVTGADEVAPPDVVVDRPRPGAGERIRVTYVFRNPKGDIRPPANLPLKNLEKEGGPGTSTQVSFINMDVTKTVSFTWALRAVRPGQGEIGETSWSVGDKTAKGHPYVVDIGPARQAADGSSGTAPSGEEDPFAMPRPFGAPFPAPRAPGNGRPRHEPLIAYLVTADRTTAYVGEEVVLHYELITQADISGLEWVDPPKFQGVWAEDLEKPEKPEPHRDTYEGQPVTRFTVLKKGVAPLTPGTVTIPPATVRLAVRMAADPFVDPFSFIRPTLLERSTKPVSIKVLPIPGHADFKGPVGKFDLHASVDHNRIAGGEAVTLKVKMTGTGNLRTSADPPRLEIPGARVYPPTAKTSTSRVAGRAVAQAEWAYVIVPSGAGDFTIPPVRIEVFDPAERRVVDKVTMPLHVFVEGTAALAAQSTPAAKGGVAETVPAAEPAPPGAHPALLASSAIQTTSLAVAPSTHTVDFKSGTVTLPLWALLGIPAGLIVAGGALIAVRKRLRSRGEIADVLRGGPDEPKERAAGRIERALRVLLQRRWGIAETAPASAILEALESAGVPAGVREGVRLLLSELDFLRFAPQLGEYGDKIDEAREQAAKVFRQLK